MVVVALSIGVTKRLACKAVLGKISRLTEPCWKLLTVQLVSLETGLLFPARSKTLTDKLYFPLTKIARLIRQAIGLAVIGTVGLPALLEQSKLEASRGDGFGSLTTVSL